MFEGVKNQKKGAENMKDDDDDELEMLLGKISHATSSFNLHSAHSDAHRQHHVDHGCDYGFRYGHGHASRVVHKMNGHGYGDELFEHKYARESSPVSGFSIKSDGSSSSLFHGGVRSLYEIGSHLEELKPQLIPGNGFWPDFKVADENKLFGDFNLSRNFSKMYVSEEECANGSVGMNFERYEASDDGRKGFLGCGGFSLSGARGNSRIQGENGAALVEMQHERRSGDPRYPPGLFDGMFSRSDFGGNVFGDGSYPLGFVVPGVASGSVGDAFRCASRNGMNLVDGRDAFYSPNVVQLTRILPRCGEENVLQYQPSVSNGRNNVPLHVRVPQGSIDAFTSEDSLIIQGESVNYGMGRGHTHLRGDNLRGLHHLENAAEKPRERFQLNGCLRVAAVRDGCHSPRTVCPFSSPSKCTSLAEAQGYIHDIAKDQHGCRFLQKIFEEGTSQDVQIIFNEIIDHVVELMINPFGNYLMQKLLEVCNEEQKTHILLRVTEEPEELVRISLNTHGTRVVQKLIETLKTRQQKSLVISALEPGFLALIKDLNGNHVVQRCLQCFTTEDSKFIFVAAAKYCVDIAMHQHGCCVLQRCISHSTGEFRENLVAEISANGLLLAQDAFGNYVVQFILELKIPSATSKLTRQFEGNYVNLSRQKFSSHVIEKCLVVCNNETRSKIIHELLSATYFEQLLQDPHANYVVQTALRVTEGSLHSSLVNAIESYKMISRNSPYSKRIFSHKVLKR
ncbi:putative pumilio homolog 7, chloroplastic [Salvia miltiorrhiza]|uniref:putative pumilio homolog 7, chloroplastic n=1 Tax=Salvia miltiorrhiza TaxID=226208 RepID=UPI0025AC35F5|nr:putative pumilio homolog 7, chloroplastic [Salvia miltiorrhiza]